MVFGTIGKLARADLRPAGPPSNASRLPAGCGRTLPTRTPPRSRPQRYIHVFAEGTPVPARPVQGDPSVEPPAATVPFAGRGAAPLRARREHTRHRDAAGSEPVRSPSPNCPPRWGERSDFGVMTSYPGRTTS